MSDIVSIHYHNAFDVGAWKETRELLQTIADDDMYRYQWLLSEVTAIVLRENVDNRERNGSAEVLHIDDGAAWSL
jgi:hypothetical protein